MIILAIETSCDETATALLKAENKKMALLSNIVSSQIKLHARWGGVVPNLAAREHLKNIQPVITRAFRNAKINPDQIDLIAVTNGPGLIPSLLIGTAAAQTLSFLWKKPLIGIHHIEGHIYANFIKDETGVNLKSQFSISKKIYNSDIKFPILCLVVSGGHTQLVLMKKHLRYEIIGQTLDDAAGEAFDKVARILGLSYPGGPAIAAKAAKFKKLNFIKNSKLKIQNYISLPRPMINSGDFNFSFSGLKTAVLYKVKEFQKLLSEKKLSSDDYDFLITGIASEFQQAVIDVLVSKTIKSATKYQVKTIMLAGGVSANQELRKQMNLKIKNNLSDSKFITPNPKFCIDNAAMIASAAYFRWKNMSSAQRKKTFQNWKHLSTDANLKLS